MSTLHIRARRRDRQAGVDDSGPGAPNTRGARSALPAPATPARWARVAALLSLPLMAWALSGIGLPVAGVPLATAGFTALPRLGALLIAAGGLWALWAAWTLAEAGSSVWPGDAPQVLVDEGPFRLGRHPMALGMAVALGGAALAAGSPLALLVLAAWVAVQQRWLLAEEEVVLRRSFGGWYRDYEARTRRWF